MQTLTFDISVFSSLDGEDVNNLILETELKEAGLSVLVVSFPEANKVDIHLDDEIPDNKKTDVQAICAAHKGGSFSPENQGVFNGSASASGEERAVAATLSTGPMREGDYMFIWYAELSLENGTGSSVALGRLKQSSGIPVIIASHSTGGATPSNMGGVLPVSFKNGEEFSFSLTIEVAPQSAGQAVARIENAQLFIRKA